MAKTKAAVEKELKAALKENGDLKVELEDVLDELDGANQKIEDLEAKLLETSLDDVGNTLAQDKIDSFKKMIAFKDITEQIYWKDVKRLVDENL